MISNGISNVVILENVIWSNTKELFSDNKTFPYVNTKWLWSSCVWKMSRSWWKYIKGLVCQGHERQWTNLDKCVQTSQQLNQKWVRGWCKTMLRRNCNCDNKLNYITHQEPSLKSLALLLGVPAKEPDVTLPQLGIWWLSFIGVNQVSAAIRFVHNGTLPYDSIGWLPTCRTKSWMDPFFRTLRDFVFLFSERNTDLTSLFSLVLPQWSF